MTPYQYEAVLPPPFRIKAEKQNDPPAGGSFLLYKNVPPNRRDTFVSFRNTILAQVAFQQFAA